MNIRKQVDVQDDSEKPFRGCGCTYIPTILGDTCESLIGEVGSNSQCIGNYLECNTGKYCGELIDGTPGETNIPPGALCSPAIYRDGQIGYMSTTSTIIGPEVISVTDTTTTDTTT
jgi:hypothetical protein